MKVIKNSPEGTPDDEIMFVIEYPEVSRIKMRKVDVEREIKSLTDEVKHKEDRKTELKAILSEMKKL